MLQFGNQNQSNSQPNLRSSSRLNLSVVWLDSEKLKQILNDGTKEKLLRILTVSCFERVTVSIKHLSGFHLFQTKQVTYVAYQHVTRRSHLLSLKPCLAHFRISFLFIYQFNIVRFLETLRPVCIISHVLTGFNRLWNFPLRKIGHVDGIRA